METIRLKEHLPCEVNLSIEEVFILRNNFSQAVDVWPSLSSNQYNLKAKNYIGVIVLPTGKRIIIDPKVPIETIFAILARVYDPNKEVFTEESQTYETINALFEFVVAYFANLTEDLISRGLLRGYRNRIEDIQPIRGRLLIGETIKCHPGLYDRHICLSRNFSPDIPENRILLWTTFGLRVWKYQDRNLPVRLHRIQHAMHGVEFDSDARRLLRNLEYHRLNDPYQPALQVARLILDYLSFSGLVDDEPFLAYLIDMNKLFQDYLSVVFEQELINSSLYVKREKHHDLDTTKSITIKPDLVLFRNNNPLLVIDAKYKIDSAQDDIYQMIAYCHGVGVKTAFLVHPETETNLGNKIIIRGPGEFTLDYVTLDLSGGPEKLAENSKNVVQKVIEYYREPGLDTMDNRRLLINNIH